MPNKGQATATEPEWLAQLRAKLRDLRYGVVQLVVHDGQVTQIERTEKTRLGSDPGNSTSRVDYAPETCPTPQATPFRPPDSPEAPNLNRP
ncbi:MAG TPA: YezD family protein [Opitutaceae bacterium]|jgi:hypothetical protein